MVFERDEMFEVILSDATGGAKIGSINRTAVTITNDDGKYIFSHPLPQACFFTAFLRSPTNGFPGSLSLGKNP